MLWQDGTDESYEDFRSGLSDRSRQQQGAEEVGEKWSRFFLVGKGLKDGRGGGLLENERERDREETITEQCSRVLI